MGGIMVRWGYCLLRWVPNPARGEFVNIAAVVFNDTGGDALVRVSNLARAKRLGPVPEAIADMVETLLRPLLDAPPHTRFQEVERMHRDHRNLLQVTPPMPMAVSDGEEALAMIFETQVGDE